MKFVANLDAPNLIVRGAISNPDSGESVFINDHVLIAGNLVQSPGYGFDTTECYVRGFINNPDSGEPVVIDDDLQVNGVGTGAGFDTWQVAASATANPTSTTNVTIAGFSQAVTSPSTSAVYLAHIHADIEITTGVQIIELLVDGVAQAAQLVTQGNGTRQPGSKLWRITGLSAGSHTFTARTRNTAGSTNTRVWAGHSLMTIERKA